jgi:putative spermidine/putrescine transport system substrate-binding protein
MELERREFLKKGALVTSALAFPNILLARDKSVKIRVLGTHVTLQEVIRQRAEQELNMEIEFYSGGSAEVLMKAITNPKSFDIYEQWSNSIRLLWSSGAIQPIEIDRLKYWGEINQLPKTGKIRQDVQSGAGDVPNKILYIQSDGSLNSSPTEKISFMPYVHNVDSFGYNRDRVQEGVPYHTESWAWLLDEKYHGRVALVNEPTIGLFDAVLAVQAKKLMEFNDIGNLSRKEIDKLFEILIGYKESGHFRGVWNSVPHSVELMATNQVDIQSMFSPGVASLKGAGVPCIYAAPKEGYRAWYGVMSLSSQSKGKERDGAYRYMNWWLSGWAGAFIARQGYYISNPERSQPLMHPDEWDYWYRGLPAKRELKGTDGRVSVKTGEIRRGGSYIQRFSNIAVWNTVMPNFEYALKRWNHFVRTQPEQRL